VIIVSAIWRSH